MEDTENYIKKNEGLRLRPYKCSEGKLTIGYGRNIDSMKDEAKKFKSITRKEANTMFSEDISIAINALRKTFDPEYLSGLSKDRATVLIDMMFNLGEGKFKGFKKMIKAVNTGNFDRAALEIIDSKYAKQVPNRAKRNADLMRGK